MIMSNTSFHPINIDLLHCGVLYTVCSWVVFKQFVSNNVGNENQVDVAYTELSKGFDKVDYKLLLHKLHLLNFDNNLLCLIPSYFYQRKFYVSYDGRKSDSLNSASGIPQGSNLGALFLFCVSGFVI